ncbi:alpha/beta fold hydrolase [Pendulispora albinea]|uniref:Alpha/beta hydrolase n=1 Tax=Pendulispora albinea TaxID=2741071 RepID=A0ABZ2M7Q0_9BACT
MPVFDFYGTPIAYDQAGTGDPILFLHNLGGDRTIWSAQYEALRATNRVVALDWLGYGDSAIPDSGYTIDTYLRLLGDFIEHHALRQITLVGHCFGSAMALLYARQCPHNVRALVLSSPLTAATLRPTPTGWSARLGERLQLDSAFAGMRLPSAIAAWIVRAQLGPRGRHMPAETFASLRDRWSAPGRLLPIAAIARDLPRLAELDAFRPPASFPPITTLWGANNRILSPAAGQRLNTVLQPVQALTLPGCGHLVMMEEPTSVTATIRAALCASRAPSRSANPAKQAVSH